MNDRLDWLISVDDHVLEPGHVWSSRLPARYKEVGPRLLTDDAGEAWHYEGRRIPTIGLAAAAGKKKEEFSPLPMTYDDMRPGCYDSKARIADMDRDGVLASLCFPSFPRFCGQTFYEGSDKKLGFLCIQAYNDWMIEEWAGAAPGRFIPLILIPLWDPMLAVSEIERTAGLGARAVAFSENPSPLGLPSIHDKNRYWDPVFAAASDANMPICTHLGSSSSLPKTSSDSPLIATMAMQPLNISFTCIDWLFSGVFQRHQNLKLCLSEGGIGWIPYVLERCDYVVDRQGYWAGKADFSGDMVRGEARVEEGSGGIDLSIRPSELFRQHIYGCFIDEISGAESIERIGIENVMIETDYPHTDSSWPHSLETARKRLAHLSEDQQYKVLRGNAERVFNFSLQPKRNGRLLGEPSTILTPVHAEGKMMKVGFIGLGDQGGPMARAIVDAGWPLYVWSRRPESLKAVSGIPHIVCNSVAALARECDVVELCLRDDSDVEEILKDKGLLKGVRSGGVIVNHGTGSPDICPSLADEGHAIGIFLLDAPVSGGREAAIDRTLTTMIGGDQTASDRCRPIFEAFSKTVAYLGPSGSGQLAKLINNTLLAANLKNAEDMLVVAELLGFELGGLIDVILASSGGSSALNALAHHMPMDLVSHYQGMIGKDIRHFSAAARVRGMGRSKLEDLAEDGVKGLEEAVQRVASRTT